MNILKISPLNFKGVYLSNSLEPGEQRNLGKQIRNLLVSSGIADSYEKENKDILIKGSKNGVNVVLTKHDIKRVLDDDYSRWNGKF